MQKGADIVGTDAGSKLGTSVSISADGNIVVIGAIFGPYVKVYEWNNTAWVQKGATIFGSSTGSLNSFGNAVSINESGSIIAVGAESNSGALSYSGLAFMYQWNGTSWAQIGQTIEGSEAFGSFGRAISLNAAGDRVAITESAVEGGQCKVYQYSGSSWVQMGATLAGQSGNSFGSSVDLDNLGNTVVVAAISVNGPFFGTGYVKVFSWNGTQWIQKGSTLQGATNSGDFFEKPKLNADGNTMVVGAYGTGNGYVKVFRFIGTDWVVQNNTLFGEANADFFGHAVDISDDGSIIVASGVNNDGFANNAGHVRAFANQALGLDDFSVANNISIFPNPTADIVNFNSREEIVSYEIYSLEGKLLEFKKLNNSSFEAIDFFNFRSGVYILALKTKNSTAQFKIVKK